MERWQSGRMRTLGKRVGGQPSPGFESLSLRHYTNLNYCFNLVKDFKPSGATPILLEESEAAFLLLNRFDELGPFKSREFPQHPIQAVTNSFIPFFNRTRDELIKINSKSIDLKSLDPEKCAQLSDLKRIYPIWLILKIQIHLN